MRWRIGPIPEEASYLASDPVWRPLREPSALLAQVISIPILLVTAASLLLTMALTARGLLGGITLPLFALAFVLVIPLHEAIHVLLHPGSGRHQDSVVGFWPRYLLFYGQWLGQWPRNRAIACLLAPLVLITVLPLVIAASIKLASPFLGALIIANALAAGLDLFGVALMLQVPSSSILKNNGYETYWRAAV